MELYCLSFERHLLITTIYYDQMLLNPSKKHYMAEERNTMIEKDNILLLSKLRKIAQRGHRASRIVRTNPNEQHQRPDVINMARNQRMDEQYNRSFKSPSRKVDHPIYQSYNRVTGKQGTPRLTNPQDVIFPPIFVPSRRDNSIGHPQFSKSRKAVSKDQRNTNRHKQELNCFDYEQSQRYGQHSQARLNGVRKGSDGYGQNNKSNSNRDGYYIAQDRQQQTIVQEQRVNYETHSSRWSTVAVKEATYCLKARKRAQSLEQQHKNNHNHQVNKNNIHNNTHGNQDYSEISHSRQTVTCKSVSSSKTYQSAQSINTVNQSFKQYPVIHPQLPQSSLNPLVIQPTQQLLLPHGKTVTQNSQMSKASSVRTANISPIVRQNDSCRQALNHSNHQSSQSINYIRQKNINSNSNIISKSILNETEVSKSNSSQVCEQLTNSKQVNKSSSIIVSKQPSIIVSKHPSTIVGQKQSIILNQKQSLIVNEQSSHLNCLQTKEPLANQVQRYRFKSESTVDNNIRLPLNYRGSYILQQARHMIRGIPIKVRCLIKANQVSIEVEEQDDANGETNQIS